MNSRLHHLLLIVFLSLAPSTLRLLSLFDSTTGATVQSFNSIQFTCTRSITINSELSLLLDRIEILISLRSLQSTITSATPHINSYNSKKFRLTTLEILIYCCFVERIIINNLPNFLCFVPSPFESRHTQAHIAWDLNKPTLPKTSFVPPTFTQKQSYDTSNYHTKSCRPLTKNQ